jgi:hypothetical protein
VQEYMPELITGSPHTYDLVSGTHLDRLLEGLTPSASPTPSPLSPPAKRAQRIIGAIKYFERGTCPALTKRLHCLSCVNNNPDHPDALRCAESLLAYAHANADKFCITYRARCAPRQLPPAGRTVDIDMTRGAPLATEFSGDASTTPRNVYSVLGTRAGGSILHLVKKLGVKVASTQEAEQIPTLKCSEYAVYTRIVETALGVPPDEPTVILSDNLGNVRVSENIGSSTNSRHFLIRYECLHQRIDDRQITVHHVRDPENPSDFLTKLGLTARKFDASLAYTSGWISSEGDITPP